MSDFLAMGGHAAFIWPCYALTAVIMAGLLAISIRSMRQNEKLAEQLRRPRNRGES